MKAIQTKSITKRYKDLTAVDALNLSVERPERRRKDDND